MTIRHRATRTTRAAALLAPLAVLNLASAGMAADPAWPGASGPASVVTATFLGTPGTEWLSAGAFLSDNTILIGGVSLDPDIELLGAKADVIGKDAAPLPPPKAWLRLSSVATGKIAPPAMDGTGSLGPGGSGEKDLVGELRTDAEEAQSRQKQADEFRAMGAVPGELRWSENETIETATVYRKVAWSDTAATAFLARFSPDLRKILSLRRFPRGAGSITGLAVGADGSVYLAGGTTERIRGLCEDVRSMPDVGPASSAKRDASLCPMVYVAKVSPDLSKVLWVRTAAAEMFGPRLRVLRGGDIGLATPDVRVLTPAGDVRLSSALSRARYPDSVSFNPVTGGFAKGGDFLTKTGREPYRTPYIFFYKPDGSLDLTLMYWRGPFVGVDSLRLVADAQVEKTVYDDEGNLNVFSRSHGGNNVQIRYPYDIDRFMPNGLGALPMNSPGCVMKIGPDFQVAGAGVWNDPGFVKCVGYGADGSVAWTGLAGRGRDRVGSLSDAPEGFFAYVASPRLDAFRFVSPMPACGRRVAVEGAVSDWAIVTGRLSGRPMLLFLSGAFGSEAVAKKPYPTPLRNPAQPAFGGGLMDGYALLLDLSPGDPPAPPAALPPPPRKTAGGEKSVVKEALPLLPGEGQAFRLGGESYVNVELTLREQPETGLWPRFFQGRADKGGTFTYSTSNAFPAAFALRIVHLEQDQGRQDLRVLGDRLANARSGGTSAEAKDAGVKVVLASEIALEVRGLSPWRMVEERHERGDSVRLHTRPVSTVTGVLHFGDAKVAVTNGVCSGWFSLPRSVDRRETGLRPNLGSLAVTFAVTARDLGMTAPWTDKGLLVRFTFSAYSDVRYASLELPTPPKMDAVPREEEDVLK